MILDVVGIVLLAAGLAVTTIGVYGVLHMRGLYARLHAAGMVTGPGAIAVLLASVATDGGTAAKGLLIACFLLFTAPLSSHAIARAEHLARRQEEEEEEEEEEED